jgi:hypothetical protein
MMGMNKLEGIWGMKRYSIVYDSIVICECTNHHGASLMEQHKYHLP